MHESNDDSQWDESISALYEWAEENGYEPDHVIGAWLGGVLEDVYGVSI